jgi:hypothetical protein
MSLNFSTAKKEKKVDLILLFHRCQSDLELLLGISWVETSPEHRVSGGKTSVGT